MKTCVPSCSFIELLALISVIFNSGETLSHWAEEDRR